MIKRNLIVITYALVILFLSLTGSDTFDRFNISDSNFLESLVHVAMYFIFMLLLIYENRKFSENLKSRIILISIPILYGSVMELLQNILTESRKGDLMDIMFNITGIFLAVSVWFLFCKTAGGRFK